MRGIVDKIMTFHEMRAKALNVLVANTEKALEEFASDKERIANEQAERIENFVKNLTMEVNDMFTRFWFVKERKQRKNESMTRDQVKNLADFSTFAKTFAKEARSLLDRVEKSRGRTFEQEFDKEVKQMKTYIKKRLKEFDEALNGRDDTLTSRLNKCVGHVLSRARKPFRGSSFSNRLNANAASSSEKWERDIR